MLRQPHRLPAVLRATRGTGLARSRSCQNPIHEEKEQIVVTDIAGHDEVVDRPSVGPDNPPPRHTCRDGPEDVCLVRAHPRGV